MRVLFCSFETPGLLFPLVGVARELQRRGHGVAFVCSRSKTGFLAEQGLDRIPRGNHDGESFLVRRWADPLHVAMDLKHTQFGIDAFRPDALVSHYLCHGPLLARDWTGLPLAVMGPAHYPFPRADLPSWSPLVARQAELGVRLKGVAQTYGESRRVSGLAELSPEVAAGDLLGDVYLLRSELVLEPHLASLPPQVQLVGFCLWEPPMSRHDEEVLEAHCRSGAGPILYVHHGRTYGVADSWNAFLGTIAQLDVIAVCATNKIDVPLRDMPANLLAFDHVNQSSVLSRAVGALTQAHTTAYLGALACGVPQIVVPGGVDTYDNAARVGALGVGVRIWQNAPTEDGIRTVIRTVAIADSPYARRARALRCELALASDFGRASDAVNVLARGGGRPRRNGRQTTE